MTNFISKISSEDEIMFVSFNNDRKVIFARHLSVEDEYEEIMD